MSGRQSAVSGRQENAVAIADCRLPTADYNYLLMRDQRGYTLIELLAALAILGFVITVTMVAFLERNHRMRQARETILAYQALANEAEYMRRTPYTNVQTTPDFESDTTLLAPLAPFTTAIDVEETEPGVKKNVTMTIRWGKQNRQAQLILIRAHTGGSNLW